MPTSTMVRAAQQSKNKNAWLMAGKLPTVN